MQLAKSWKNGSKRVWYTLNLKKKKERGRTDNWVKTTLLTTKRLFAPLFPHTSLEYQIHFLPLALCRTMWAIGQIGRWGNLIVSMDGYSTHVIMDLRDPSLSYFIWCEPTEGENRIKKRKSSILDFPIFSTFNKQNHVLPSYCREKPFHLAPSWCLTVHCSHHHRPEKAEMK